MLKRGTAFLVGCLTAHKKSYFRNVFQLSLFLLLFKKCFEHYIKRCLQNTLKTLGKQQQAEQSEPVLQAQPPAAGGYRPPWFHVLITRTLF